MEIVVEKVLGYENAIAEYDDIDTGNHDKKPNIKINLITQYIVDTNIEQYSIEITKQKFPNYNTYLTNGFQKLDTPPPKV